MQPDYYPTQGMHYGMKYVEHILTNMGYTPGEFLVYIYTLKPQLD